MPDLYLFGKDVRISLLNYIIVFEYWENIFPIFVLMLTLKVTTLSILTIKYLHTLGINNHRYADDTTLFAEIEEELKSLLMKVKEESQNWLKTQHSEN